MTTEKSKSQKVIVRFTDIEREFNSQKVARRFLRHNGIAVMQIAERFDEKSKLVFLMKMNFKKNATKVRMNNKKYQAILTKEHALKSTAKK